MELLFHLLLLLSGFNTSLTWATNVRHSPFKEIVCNQCQQWCESADLVTTGSIRVCEACPRGARGVRGPRGPVGRPGDVGARGKDGPVGPAGPQSVVNMTLIEKSIDRKFKEALQMLNAGSCEGSKLESASSRNDSGGVFRMFIPAVGFRGVFCDVADEGGNWTVFQRRMNLDVDFYRGWNDYTKGFGDLQGDFWLGLEAVHQMTKDDDMELKINMITKDGIYLVAKYSNFRIGPGSDFYRLTISGFSGNATYDGLAFHNNQQFTTKDADHDAWDGNCAISERAAWWYLNCVRSHLNGNVDKTDWKAMLWYDGTIRLLRYTEMKFRRRF